MDRLAPLLASPEGEADYELAFSRDTKGRPVIEGRVDAVLKLVCQRCLETLDLTVAGRIALTVVTGVGEARAEGESDTEHLLLEEQTLSPRDLVEEELLLNIPAVPRHDECRVQKEWPAADAGGEDDIGTANPFEALAALRDKNRNN